MVATATELSTAIDRFIADLQGGIRVEAVILYGSYIHGSPHDWSDIDLAVISPDFEGVRMPKRQETLADLMASSDWRLSPIGYSSSEYHNLQLQPFLHEIIRTGKVVYQAAA